MGRNLLTVTKLLSVVEPMYADTRVARLERRVDAMSKALDILLFKEAEELSPEEAEELKARLGDYLRGKKDEFLPLEELLKDV
jgi:hypothetical protein